MTSKVNTLKYAGRTPPVFQKDVPSAACIRSHGANGDDAVDMQAVVSGFVFAAPRHFGEYQHAAAI
jgi:hypothetical protein